MCDQGPAWTTPRILSTVCQVCAFSISDPLICILVFDPFVHISKKETNHWQTVEMVFCRSITCPHLLIRASAENAATREGDGKERRAMEEVVQIYKVSDFEINLEFATSVN